MRRWSWLKTIGLIPRQPQSEAVSTARSPGSVATVSGRLFNVLNPDPRQVVIGEIAHALSQNNRFNGCTKFPYSVAQHSIYCAIESSKRHPSRYDLALACLLHDAAEAYCGDVIRPLKNIPSIASAYRPIEDRVQLAICDRFEVYLDDSDWRKVKEIDNAVVMREAMALMVGCEFWQWGSTQPAMFEIRQMDSRDVRLWFLRAFQEAYELAKHRRFPDWEIWNTIAA